MAYISKFQCNFEHTSLVVDEELGGEIEKALL